jgi:NAD+ kinase
MRAVGLLQHPKIMASQDLCVTIADRLRGAGLDVHVSSAWDEKAARLWLDRVDLLVTLGGDGTILRAARMAFRLGTPILGINLGRLGFLSEINPADWEQKLFAVIGGHYWLESRMLLQAEFWRGDNRMGAYEALNEVVISRGSLARTVRLDTCIEQEYFTTYKADGVIAATPTGSTAYCLAAGGPILPPHLKNIVLLPIAPHMSMDRAVVLSADAMVDITVSSDYRAILTVDGQFEVSLQDGDRICVTSSQLESYFVRTQGKAYFYRTLMERFRW